MDRSANKAAADLIRHRGESRHRRSAVRRAPDQRGFRRREIRHRHADDARVSVMLEKEQRERFIAAYLAALESAGLPDDAAFRDAVREHVEFGAHVAQVNSLARSEAELHPIREVPHWSWEGSS